MVERVGLKLRAEATTACNAEFAPAALAVEPLATVGAIGCASKPGRARSGEAGNVERVGASLGAPKWQQEAALIDGTVPGSGVCPQLPHRGSGAEAGRSILQTISLAARGGVTPM